MARVHLLPKGVHIAPLPALRTGDVDRVLPGGKCPRGMRSQWSNAAGQHKRAQKTVYYTTPKWYEIDRELRRGERVYESAL